MRDESDNPTTQMSGQDDTFQPSAANASAVCGFFERTSVGTGDVLCCVMSLEVTFLFSQCDISAVKLV